jgi:hypothetical protein
VPQGFQLFFTPASACSRGAVRIAPTDRVKKSMQSYSSTAAAEKREAAMKRAGSSKVVEMPRKKKG